jgi:urease accessory protein
MTDGLLALLQFSDGLFPAGGFAHSLGLETYVQDGRITDGAGLDRFITAQLEGSAGPTDAAAAVLAARAARDADVAAVIAVDVRVDVMKLVPEARAASRQMGRQLLRIAAALRDDPLRAAIAAAVAQGTTHGHHAVVFGAALGGDGASDEAVATAYLYSTAAMLVGAGVRLLSLGQLDGQRVLAATHPRITRLVTGAVAARSADDLWSFTPALELAGLRHATLDARLFRS